jgi:arylsulfatase A-like enzyme/Flp pilus assembly protein TadD
MIRGTVPFFLIALFGVLPAAEAAPAPRPNLVLVTLDTTRADHLGSADWPHAKTPNLDALAARGVRFDRCDSAAPITLPSHATIHTGLFPPRHGVRDNGTFALAPRFATLAEQLGAQGYATAAVVSAVVLARRHGLDQGFARYDDDLGVGYSAGTAVSERTADATTTAALAALGTMKPPFFLWVHYFDPHEEYRPPTRFAEAARGPHRLYDGEISFVDAEIGRLLAALPATTVVAAVGDHGEMLGDQDETSHGLLLGPGARRVPLLLAGPGVPTGASESCLVRTADLAPTLLQLAGVPIPSGLDGRTLLPLAKDGGCDRLSYSESFLPFFAYKWYPLRALSDGDFVYLHAPRPSLYRLASDPREELDLAAKEPAAIRQWTARLKSTLAAMGEELEPVLRAENVLSPEQRAQLQSLGYLAGGSGGSVSGDLPDPRRQTKLARELHQAAEGVQQGRCTEVLRSLQDIVRRDPHNFPALALAGQCLRAAGREADALALFQRASAENDLSAVPIANAAGSLLALGRIAEAEREYRRALALDPTLPEAASNLARLLRERGDRTGALRVVDSALAAGSHGAAVFLERGLALAESERLEQALGAFREAARRDPTNTVAAENGARAAYSLGRTREAAETYAQILRVAPERGDLWKTLGAIYRYELGERQEAERCFRRALALEVDPQERARLEAALRE